MSPYTVKTGEKCQRCNKDLWNSLKGHLKCPCGQVLWIVRRTEATGTHFDYQQGPTLPPGYRGWDETTR